MTRDEKDDSHLRTCRHDKVRRKYECVKLELRKRTALTPNACAFGMLFAITQEHLFRSDSGGSPAHVPSSSKITQKESSQLCLNIPTNLSKTVVPAMRGVNSHLPMSEARMLVEQIASAYRRSPRPGSAGSLRL